jgi:hypothetical protein
MQQWLLETYGRVPTKSLSYPNVNGNGQASLALIEPYWGDKDIQKYAYVAGLRIDDPHDLVLMYLKEKTRYNYHGDAEHNIFSPSFWMVLSPDISSGGCPEGGDLVDTREFRRRLLLTLAFLEREQRPHWQTVVAEQKAFLNSIGE